MAAGAAVNLLGQEQLLLDDEVPIQVAKPGARSAVRAVAPTVAAFLEEVLAIDRRLQRPDAERTPTAFASNSGKIGWPLRGRVSDNKCRRARQSAIAR